MEYPNHPLHTPRNPCQETVLAYQVFVIASMFATYRRDTLPFVEA